MNIRAMFLNKEIVKRKLLEYPILLELGRQYKQQCGSDDKTFEYIAGLLLEGLDMEEALNKLTYGK